MEIFLSTTGAAEKQNKKKTPKVHIVMFLHMSGSEVLKALDIF